MVLGSLVIYNSPILSAFLYDVSIMFGFFTFFIFFIFSVDFFEFVSVSFISLFVLLKSLDLIFLVLGTLSVGALCFDLFVF